VATVQPPMRKPVRRIAPAWSTVRAFTPKRTLNPG
jgi:hypothetical protein